MEQRTGLVSLRTVKAAVSATLCALLYALFGRDPTFACIGCVFGMGADLEDSWQSGGNRLMGTVIGGFLGAGLFWVHLRMGGTGNISLYPLLFTGIVLLGVFSAWFRWPRAMQPGGVVLCIILFGAAESDYLRYAISRMLDTSFGVFLSMCLNLLFPRARLVCWWGRVREAFSRGRNAG